MVGRGNELARLHEVFGRLRRGGDPVVALVSGVAGVGKSRLVGEFCASLGPGVRTFLVACDEGSGRPLGALLDAFEPAVRGWQGVPALLAEHREAVEDLLAPVAPRFVGGAVSSDLRRRAAVRVVGHLVGTGPGLIIFEDLQWSDQQSLAVFGTLAATPGLGALVVGTHRLGESTGALAEVLGAVERRCVVTHVTVGPLGMSGVAELLAAVYRRPVPLRAVEAVLERSGGNPFFVEEMVAAAGDAPLDQLGEVALPETVTEAVLRHFDSLPDRVRTVAEAASILGRRVPFELLAAVTGLGEDALLECVGALVRCGILVEERGDTFAFRHDLTRDAVAGRLLSRPRRRLHARAAAALSAAGSTDWSALAHHAARAGRPDDVVAVARSGGAAFLAGGSTQPALRLAELGLSHVPGDPELTELAAHAASASGLPDTGLRHARAWEAAAREAGDVADRLRALVLVARLEWDTCDWAGQERSVGQALSAAGSAGPSRELVLAYDLAAESARLRHEPAKAIDWAHRGLDLADRIGADDLRPQLLINLAAARACSTVPKRVEAAALILETAVGRAEAVGVHWAVLRGLRVLLVTMARVWPWERTRATLEQMDAVCDRFGREDWRGELAWLWASYLGEGQGDLLAARASLTALAYDEALLDTSRARWAPFMAAQLAIEADDPAAAAFVHRARRQALERANPYYIVWADALDVEFAARRRDASGLDTGLRALAAGVGRKDAPWVWDFFCDNWFSSLVAAVAGGLPPEVIGEIVDQAGLPPHVGHVHNDPAWPDHFEAALAAYGRALSGNGRRRWVPFAADVHQGRARCLLALRRRDEARTVVGEAVTLLARWPGWRRREAISLSRRLGGKPAPEPGAAAGGLSARELEVAALLGAGLSNAELARRLYISPRTAAVHVSHIFTKLGMSSRAEVAAWAVREGLTS